MAEKNNLEDMITASRIKDIVLVEKRWFYKYLRYTNIMFGIMTPFLIYKGAEHFYEGDYKKGSVSLLSSGIIGFCSYYGIKSRRKIKEQIIQLEKGLSEE